MSRLSFSTPPDVAGEQATRAIPTAPAPLTEALALQLGPLRGAEELTVHVNRVYGGLIGVLERYGGGVINFSGDTITCWLDRDDGRQAVAAGVAVQDSTRQFAEVRSYSGRIVSLACEVAVAAASPFSSSILVVLATDAPLLPVQCRRLARRATVGLARACGTGHAFSGDLFLASSTGNHCPPSMKQLVEVRMFPLGQMNPLFDAAPTRRRNRS